MLTRIFDSLLHSVRGRLIMLTAVVIVPAALLAANLIYEAHRNEREAVERQLSETSHALSLVVDRQLGQSEALLTALATSPSLKQRDLAAFYQQAREALPDSGRWIVLTGPDGRQLVNTLLPYGAALPDSSPFPVYENVIGTRSTYISSLKRGLRHRHVLFVAVPVVENASVRYGLAMTMVPSEMSDVLADQKLPQDWVAAIIDADGTLVARNRNPHRFVGANATPDIRQYITERSSGVVESVTLDGVETIGAFTRSDHSGWTVIIGAPRSEVYASAFELLLLAIAVSFVLVMVGFVGSRWVARGVVDSVDALTSAAAAIGRGEIPELETTGMMETDQVAQVLHTSAVRLKQRESELQHLNESLETRVAEATETLVQAQKLEAIGHLTGGVAHDFNNLLMAVQMNLEMLAETVTDEDALEFVQSARQAADRGARLTAQLLAFARRQRLDPEAVDVNTVVEAMGSLLRSTLGGAIRVELDLDSEIRHAYADRTQLELILMNLAINARDAVGDNGTVRVSTGLEAVTKEPVRSELPPPGEYVVVSVSDSGTGIPPDVLERVFEPFFTTKEVGKGSGLGLPQALGVVKQLGGGIAIETKVGGGTTVRIYLPLADDVTVSRAGAGDDATAAPDVTGLTVLLVDDDAQVRMSTSAILRSMSCMVLAADGGPEALEHIRSDASIDVALVDYAMPEMTGLELASLLSELRPDVPVILMSGYVYTDGLERTDHGTVLQKPLSKEQLMRALADVVVARS